ncbi:hypothetical protein HY968_01915 [Candidatus Kaiserbacteria bacterium]|nr:hypothetical protein [Candidatus Kaiserbacteria bacterium]
MKLKILIRKLFPKPYPQVASGSRGFTLLLAALVSSIVLALGASIFEIASREVTLSSIGRDSQFAFYAADQGAECALYWDLRYLYFATSSPANVVSPDPRCDGQSLEVSGRPISAPYYPYTMTFTYSPNVSIAASAGGNCATVSVQKSLGSNGVVRTAIHADGFNTTCSAQSTSPRALQRSVELHY